MNGRRWLAAAGAALLVPALVAAAWWRFGREMPVPVVEVVEAALPRVVAGPGNVQARVPVTLASRITATVTGVAADVGDAVRAGQPLVTLDDRELQARRHVVLGQRESQRRNVEAAEAALDKARADLVLARGRQQRDADLVASGFVSAAGMDASQAALASAEAAVRGARATLQARQADLATSAQELTAAEVAASYSRLSAPLDAVVVQRLVEPGTTVVPGTPLLRLVDPTSVWVAARIDEVELGRLTAGQAATIRLRSGDRLAGRVVRVARLSDAATREVDVHVAFEQIPPGFVIDAEAEVRIRTGEQRGLRVPLAALVRDRDGRPGVLRLDDGRARFVPVRAAAGDGGLLLVEPAAPRPADAARLAAGDRVVAPAAGVRDGMRVRAAD
jgi:RND family efflux transporter MFP subunit